MIEVKRIPIARFKYNMRPYIDAAKAGEQVIVTLNGHDEFRVIACEVKKPGRMPHGTVLDSKVDLDEPAFPPLSNESPA